MAVLLSWIFIVYSCCVWNITNSSTSTESSKLTSDTVSTPDSMMSVASTEPSSPESHFDYNETGTTTVEAHSDIPPLIQPTDESFYFNLGITFFVNALEEADFIVKNDNETRAFIASFSDVLQKQLVETQLLNCPFVSLCNYTLPLEQYPSPLFGQSCCAPCQCDYPRCLGANKCCPDILRPPDLVKRGIKLVKQCIPNKLTTYTSGVEGVVGFDVCPNGTVSELMRNCTRGYQTNMKYLEDLLPCISNKTTNVYRNKYCALCHGEVQRDLEFFKTRLSGFASGVSFPSTEEELISTAFVNQLATIEFDYKQDDENIEYCQTTINSCNETGQWVSHSASAAEACSSYSSEIMVGTLASRYQNVFCALCNDETVTTPECAGMYTPSRPYGFSGLLNTNVYRLKIADDGPQQKQCGESEFYNKITKVCMQTVCSPIHAMIDGECMPTYTMLTDMPYTLYVRLLPIQPLLFHDAFLEMENITDALHTELPEDLSHNLCATQTVLVVDEQYVSDDAYMDNKTIQILYIQIKLQFYFSKDFKHNTTRLIKEAELTLHNEKLSTEIYNFTMKVYDQGMQLFSNILALQHKEYLDPFAFYHKNTYGAEMPIVPQDEEPPVLLYDVNNFTIISYESPTLKAECDSILHHTTKPFFDLMALQSCLKVTINVSEYAFDIKSDGSIVFNNSFTIDSNRYIASSYLFDDSILVCVEDFDNYLDTLVSNSSTDDNPGLSPEVIVSLICSGLSILSLTITMVTFLVLPKLRATLPGKNNLTLVLMLLVANILFLISSVGKLEQNSTECKAMGIAVHLQWLLAIFWMNICTYHMFRTLTKNTLMTRGSGCGRMLIYHAYALVLSMGFVAVNIIVSSATSGTVGYGLITCYISSMEMLVYTFAVPVGCVVLSNLIMFLVVIIEIKRSPSVQKNVKNERNDLLVLTKLSTATGLTWVFGVVNIWIRSVVLDYIFSVLNASQGVLIFLAFVANMRVVNLYRDTIRRSRERSSTRNGTFFTTSRTENMSTAQTTNGVKI